MGFFDVFKRNGKAETPKENYTDYSRYLQYTYNPWKPGADKRTVVNMRYAGWKMLLGEALSEGIERELGLRYLGNGIWADDYVNHCRKVLTLFKINDAFVTFQWGLNFDFVPVIKSKGKAGYITMAIDIGLMISGITFLILGI